MQRLSTFADVANSAINAYSAGQDRRRQAEQRAQEAQRMRTLAEIGAQIQGGADVASVAPLALQAGDLQGFTRLSQLATQDRNFTRQTERDAVSDGQFEQRIGLQRENIAADNRRADQQFGLQRQQAALRNQRANETPNTQLGKLRRDLKRGLITQDDFNLALERFKGKETGAGSFGKSPIFAQDQNGQTVLLQLNSNGGVKKVETPEGVTISSGIQKVDLGTGTGLIDKRTGKLIGTVNKDIIGAETAKLTGKARGKARGQLQRAKLSLSQTVRAVDELLEHPGLDSSVGTLQGQLPDGIVGVLNSDAADFRSRLSQAQGQAFLRAFESLKGGGTITEVEGLKAERALARLNTATSEADFKQALMDFKQAVQDGFAALQREAGGADRQQATGQARPIPPNVLQEAQAAIQAGADPNAVRQRLQQSGYSVDSP